MADEKKKTPPAVLEKRLYIGGSKPKGRLVAAKDADGKVYMVWSVCHTSRSSKGLSGRLKGILSSGKSDRFDAGKEHSILMNRLKERNEWNPTHTPYVVCQVMDRFLTRVGKYFKVVEVHIGKNLITPILHEGKPVTRSKTRAIRTGPKKGELIKEEWMQWNWKDQIPPYIPPPRPIRTSREDWT